MSSEMRRVAVVVALAVAALLGPVPAAATVTGPAAQAMPRTAGSGGATIDGRMTPIWLSDVPGDARVGPRTGDLRAFPVRSTFIVSYQGFSAPARTAFAKAVDLWSRLVVSSEPIRVTASWEAMPSGQLGAAGPADYHRDFFGAPRPATWYPAALANARVGDDLSTGPDIEASFSSAVSWHYGTDGETPAGKVDLVTVVMHELAHGLGLVDSTEVRSGRGYWGLGSGYPFVFDRQVQTSAGTSVASLANGSTTLGAALQSDSLRWGGAAATAAHGGVTPRIYSPNPYRPGSSIAHLNESSFPDWADGGLLTPFLGSGSSIHDPGDVGLGMLRDMGWSTAGPRTVPSAPAAPSIVVGDGRVLLRWSVPSDTGRQRIEGYTAALYAPPASAAVRTGTTHSTSRTISFSGLTNGAEYRGAVTAENASGAGPQSARTSVRPVDVRPFTWSDAFVAQQATDFLGRSPTTTELLTWLAPLHSGAASPARTVWSVASATDSYGPSAQATRLYSAFFLRLPDRSGHQYWIGRLRGGTPITSVANGFAGSAEFQQRYGSLGNAAFVRLVYQNVLGRAPDSAGLAFWTGKLDRREMSRGKVMVGFSESQENVARTRTTVISVLLRSGMLRRMPTPAEIAADGAVLASAPHASVLAREIFSSAEYVSRFP